MPYWTSVARAAVCVHCENMFWLAALLGGPVGSLGAAERWPALSPVLRRPGRPIADAVFTELERPSAQIYRGRKSQWAIALELRDISL